jgi:hypothetical protein
MTDIPIPGPRRLIVGRLRGSQTGRLATALVGNHSPSTPTRVILSSPQQTLA